MIEEESLPEVCLNKNDIPDRGDAVGLSLKCINNLSPLLLEYTLCESLSTLSPSMARPFLEACYDPVVPRQQLVNKPLHCVPNQNKRLMFHVCFLSRQLLMNCTFILANTINSKFVLFSTRFAAKVVLNGCYEYEF